MSVNIKAPSLKPPRVSILSSAEVIDIPGDKWWGGIEFKKLSGNPAEGIDSAFDQDDTFILPICPVDAVNKESFPRSPNDRVQPFAIYATDECSTFGISGADLLDRAKQKLLAAEAWTIEHELWFGTATTNFSFADDSISLASGQHPLIGFTLVDAMVAQNRADGRGMVHLTPRTFDLLQQYDLFRREGNVWFSPLDNIVVPGRGYANEGESEDSPIYGHPGTIQILRSDVFTFPENAEQVDRQINRATNDQWVVAERVVSYILSNQLGDDGETSVYSAGVDLSLAYSGTGGGGGDASAANQELAIAALEQLDLNSDQVEALVSALGSNTDNIESLLAPTIVAEPVTGDEAIASANWLHGWSVWNTTAGLAEVTIHNGTTSGGPVLARFRLAENESYTVVFPKRLPAPDGVHFEAVTGTVVGTVYYEV